MNVIDIQLPEEFLNEEIREDYKVSSKSKRIWAVQLDLLSKLLEVCKKNDIEITVFAGTLLGAIRHKGFIPWDDDIDVCLTRENYEKLLRIAPKEFEGKYFFQNALTDKKYFIGYSRLRNSETTGIIKWNNHPDYNNGIYIDIFPLDGYTSIENKLQMQFKLRAFIKKLCSAFYADSSIEKGFRRISILLLQKTIFKIIHYENLVEVYNKILKMYNYEERISLLTHSESFVRRYWCKKKDLNDVIWVPFENISVPVPKNYNEVLKNIYGDYMKFPPVEQRGTWHGDSLILDPDISYKEYMKK